MDEKAFKAEIVLLLTEAAKKERRAPKYGFSDAAGCARQHVYAFREYETTGALTLVSTPLRWVYQKACGDGVGAELEAAARRLGWQTQVLVRWEVEGLVVEGTADVVGPDFVLDGKYVSKGTWGRVQKTAKQEHRVQVHGYAHALGKAWVGVLYQKFTEAGEVVPYIGHVEQTDASVAAQVHAHWVGVELHRRAGTLPDRPFGRDSFECGQCPYVGDCWRVAA